MHPQHDIGFSDTVSNVVEIVKEERVGHRGYRQNGRYPRGMFTPFYFYLHRFVLFLRIVRIEFASKII